MADTEFFPRTARLIVTSPDSFMSAPRRAVANAVRAGADDCPWCGEPAGDLGTAARPLACPGCGEHVTGRLAAR